MKKSGSEFYGHYCNAFHESIDTFSNNFEHFFSTTKNIIYGKKFTWFVTKPSKVGKNTWNWHSALLWWSLLTAYTAALWTADIYPVEARLWKWAEWSPPAIGRTQSVTAVSIYTAIPFRQSLMVNKTLVSKGRRSRHKGWSGWLCRRGSCVLGLCWRLCPGRVPRSSCRTSRCGLPVLALCPIPLICNSLAGLYPLLCCWSLVLAISDVGPPVSHM